MSTELDAVAAIVHRTRAEQGLPPTIEDPSTLGRLARLFEPARDTTPVTTRGRVLRSVTRGSTESGSDG